jgi:hypothetical protein
VAEPFWFRLANFGHSVTIHDPLQEGRLTFGAGGGIMVFIEQNVVPLGTSIFALLAHLFVEER